MGVERVVRTSQYGMMIPSEVGPQALVWRPASGEQQDEIDARRVPGGDMTTPDRGVYLPP